MKINPLVSSFFGRRKSAHFGLANDYRPKLLHSCDEYSRFVLRSVQLAVASIILGRLYP